MLFFDELEQLRRLGLLHQLERIAVLERREQTVGHVVGLAGAERALQDLLRVFDPALVDVLEGDRALVGFLDDGVAALDRDRRDLRDLEDDALDLVLPQELEDRGRELEPDRDHQDRGLLRSRDVGYRRRRVRLQVRIPLVTQSKDGLVVDHGYSASQSLTSLAMLSGLS